MTTTKTMIKRIVCTALAPLTVPLFLWLLGWNFEIERGVGLALSVLTMACIGWLAYIVSGLRD